MLFPKMVQRPLLILCAAVTVSGSGLLMNQLVLTNTAQAPLYEVVAQSSVSPSLIAPPEDETVASGFDNCAVTMDLMEDANAMIGITLIAPCLPNADVMISHAGLTFTATTMATGTLFVALPALEKDAEVTAHFTTGEIVSGKVEIPEITKMQRFAVQWVETDGFAIHAFQDGAGFDDAGHIWAQNAGAPAANTGYLTQLGNPNADMPVMAAVYTFAPRVQAEVVVEAAVTENTCGLDLMGDAIESARGTVSQTEITLAMPNCEAVGEFVQIGGLVTDTKLAMAN